MTATQEVARSTEDVQGTEELAWMKRGHLLKVAGDVKLRDTNLWRYEVGDWWNEGERYGHRRKLMAQQMEIPYGTLSTWATGAKAVKESSRRRELGMEKARVLASVPEDDREQWIDKALKLTKNKLAKAIKESRRPALDTLPADESEPVEGEFVGCLSGDNAWEDLEAALSRIVEQSYPLTKARWNRIKRDLTKVSVLAEQDAQCKTPHLRMTK